MFISLGCYVLVKYKAVISNVWTLQGCETIAIQWCTKGMKPCGHSNNAPQNKSWKRGKKTTKLFHIITMQIYIAVNNPEIHRSCTHTLQTAIIWQHQTSACSQNWKRHWKVSILHLMINLKLLYSVWSEINQTFSLWIEWK